MDLADAYVRAYDRMTPCGGARCEVLRRRAERVAKQVREAVEDSGGMSLPDAWLEAPARSAKLLGVLLALHRVLLDAGPERTPPSMGRRAVLQGRLARTRRLNTDSTDGALVYTRTICGRPDRFSDKLDQFLPGLRRIPESDWKLMRLSRVKAVFDFDLGRASPTETEPTVPMLIAQLPFLADRDDLQWEAKVGDYYRVAPRPERLKGHVKATLAAFDDSRACLGILPETSLDDELLAEWRALMAKGCPPGQKPTWLLVGTGPVQSVGPTPCVADRPPNRAVLLHRPSGKTLMTQDKQFGFTLDGGRQQEYGLRDASWCDLGGIDRGEWIAHGETLSILDSRSGRYAILICEDVGRLLDTGRIIAIAGVSHVLVPVLAAAMHKNGWSGKAAESLALDAGAAVAVSNGLAIHRFIPAKHCGNDPYCPAPTLLAATPARTRPIQSHGSYTAEEVSLPKELAGIDAREDARTPRCSYV
jgi:hypothetical protein